MLNKFISFLGILFICAGVAFAENNLNELQIRAFNNIQRAQQVVAYAQKLMEVRPDRQSAEACVDLYLEAAKLYGDAARLLKVVGPPYVLQSVVDEFAKGEQNYLDIVDKIRRSLNQGEIVSPKKDTFESLLNELKELSQ
ncbi:MAG: hypothetical protein PHY73_03050 [Candidatus Omnitrophica bacterium]|nr:hypothetical protein [Candidatus Omnitrophota bacterium]